VHLNKFYKKGASSRASEHVARRLVGVVMAVDVVYCCLVCGKCFTSRQALAAHMRVHKDVEFVKTSFRLPKDLAERFVEVCHRHHTTACHVIYTLIQAFVEGEKRGLVDISTKNPVIVYMHQYFAARPRGHGKYALPPGFEPGGPFEVPRCGYVQSVSLSAGEVFCSRAGTWVRPEVCRGCRLQRGFIKLG